jgi:hypothetical protein
MYVTRMNGLMMKSMTSLEAKTYPGANFMTKNNYKTQQSNFTQLFTSL